MSTQVAVIMVRSYTGPDMFADIPGLATVAMTRVLDKPTGVSTLTFDADLDATTVTAIRDRATSRDDADQAKRAALRDLCAAATADDPETLRAAICGAIDYLLGE